MRLSRGFKLFDDPDVEFPRVKEVNTSTWGIHGYKLDAGTIFLTCNNESLYKKNAASIQKRLENNAGDNTHIKVLHKGVIKEMKILNYDRPVSSRIKNFEKTSKNQYARLYPAKRDGKICFIDAKGEEVIKIQFEGIKDESYGIFKEGLIGVSETCQGDKFSCEGGWYFINKDAKKVIDGSFQEVSTFQEGVCWVKKNNLWGLINKQGDWLIEPQLQNKPSAFYNGISQGWQEVDTGGFSPGKEYFYFNRKGEVVWKP